MSTEWFNLTEDILDCKCKVSRFIERPVLLVTPWILEIDVSVKRENLVYASEVANRFSHPIQKIKIKATESFG